MGSELRDTFRDPERAQRTAAFWFWHRLPEPAETEAQLADFADRGIGAVLVQGRLALPRQDWLSPAWLAALAHASKVAEGLGIGVEIYDEYNWITGQGGGRVVAGADHLRERHLFWTGTDPDQGPDAERGAALTVTAPAFTFLDFLGPVGRDWIWEGGHPVWADWQIVAALAHPACPDGPEALRDITGQARLEDAGPDGARIRLAPGTLAPGEAATVFVAARCASSRLVNYLLPETAERFIRTVAEPLVRATGGRAEASFFDHPHAGFYDWPERRGDPGNSLLWSDALGAELAGEDAGEDAGDGGARAGTASAASGAAAPGLGPALYAVLHPLGDRGPALRARSWRIYGARLHEAFFGTLSRWYAARGIAFSGHELLAHVGGYDLRAGLPGIDLRCAPGLDVFGVDAFRGQTTVDAADYAPQLSARLGDSVARAHGRSRCTVEQYSTGRPRNRPGGAGQWDLSPGLLRRQMIRHLIGGARRVMLHALWLDDGADGQPAPFLNPRFDFPPGFNFQPWWQDMRPLTDEMARLSAFLDTGRPLRPVALLYPLETLRCDGPVPAAARSFGLWAEALAAAGIGHDILDHRQIGAARIAGGRLHLPGACYDTLILPDARVMASETELDRLAGFARGGGRLIISGQPPEATAAGGLRPVGAPVLPGIALASEPGAIGATVAALPRPVPGAVAGAGPLPQQVAATAEGWRLALFNDCDVPVETLLQLPPGTGQLLRWDPGDGSRHPMTVPGPGGLTLAPQELLLLSPATPAAGPPSPTGAGEGNGDGDGNGAGAAPGDGRRRVPETERVLDRGWLFTPGTSPAPAAPISPLRGWEMQGHPRFCGTGIYRLALVLPPLPPGAARHLCLPRVAHVAEVRLGGRPLGTFLTGTARVRLPSGAIDAPLEIRVRNSAANHAYAQTPWQPDGPDPSGLLAAPVVEVVAG